jgi:hypothetical protein
MKAQHTVDGLRGAQEKIITDLAEAHQIPKSEVIVDIRRVGKERIVWSARLPTKVERDARDQQVVNANAQALRTAERKPFVFVSVKGKLQAWLMKRIGCVYLSERGARDAGGTVAKIEVRA